MISCNDSRLPIALIEMRVFEGTATACSYVLESIQADQVSGAAYVVESALFEPLPGLPCFVGLSVAGGGCRSGNDAFRCWCCGVLGLCGRSCFLRLIKP